MDCHLKNKRLEIDEEGKHLIFPLFLDVASFLEEIYKCIMCDLNVNELNYVSNINHPYSCTVNLTHDNIFCDIEKMIKNESEEKTIEQMISDEVVKSKIFDKMEIDGDDDPLKELVLLMDDVKKELHSDGQESGSPTSKKRRVDMDTEQNYFIENLQSLTFDSENYDNKLLTSHLDVKLSKTIASDLQKFKENIPKIRDTFNVIFCFVLILKKTLAKIPTYIDPETKELKIHCEGCPIHCIGNWKFSKPVGRPSTSQNEHCSTEEEKTECMVEIHIGTR